MALNTRCEKCGTRLGAEDFTAAGELDCLLCKKLAPADQVDDSPFESMGRQRKVIAMVEVIDRNALNNGINPYDQAGRILLAARDWEEKTWRSIALRANPKSKKPPSDKTRAMVISVYRDRATAPLSRQGLAS
jgi:hypothetical protein